MSAASSARLERTALVVGAVGLLGCAVGLLVSGLDAFLQSYLVGSFFWIEIAFGCMGLAMIHGLTGGGWGMFARRPLHAAASTMPLCAALFLPVIAGASRLYRVWADPKVVLADELIRHKSAYLNVPFFTGRAVFYFVLWSAIALLLFKRASRTPEKPPGRGLRTIAGPGILASALTMSFAAIDWLMSLDPHWFSTMFGLLIIVGSMLSGLCFSIVVLTSEYKGDEIPTERLHDLGKLLLLFTMLWGYLSFSQYLIIYAGNMAEDVPFYAHRAHGGWQHLALSLIVLHFCVPFTVLLTRRTKRSPRALRMVASGILVMRFIELYWFAAPNFHGHHMQPSFLDFAAPLGVGGIWVFWFLRRQTVFSQPLSPTAPARDAA